MVSSSREYIDHLVWSVVALVLVVSSLESINMNASRPNRFMYSSDVNAYPFRMALDDVNNMGITSIPASSYRR